MIRNRDQMIKPDREFRDPIHGFIPVYDEELKIIQDPIFQRLRRIKQLSFAYFVYHGAEHSRFGHVLGTMHLVDKALRKIRMNGEKLNLSVNIDDEDIRLARFAALLHDVGHKPFSHALDKGIPESHEDYAELFVLKRFYNIIEESKIDPQQVANLIQGNTDPEKPFLTNLISGQFDVDKFDYLLRDSHYAGVKYGLFDLDRLLDSLFVKDGSLVILDDGFFAAEQLITARYHMFSQVYLHKTKRAFEGMIIKVAENLISENKIKYPSVNDLNDPEVIDEFVKYDDAWLLEQIKTVEKDTLQKIAKDIEKREPYKEVCNSEIIRRRMGLNKQEGESIGYHNAMEENVKANLKNIGIDENEIIFDRASSLPYKLRPYSNTADGQTDEYADIVFIYDHRTNSKEPIENKSKIVKAIAQKFSIHRMFTTKEKKPILHEYLKENFIHFS